MGFSGGRRMTEKIKCPCCKKPLTLIRGDGIDLFYECKNMDCLNIVRLNIFRLLDTKEEEG